jgi:ribosomal protein S3
MGVKMSWARPQSLALRAQIEDRRSTEQLESRVYLRQAMPWAFKTVALMNVRGRVSIILKASSSISSSRHQRE